MKALMTAFALPLVAALAGCNGSPLSPVSTPTDGSAAAPSFSQFSDIPIPAKASMNVDQTLLIGHGNEWVGRLVYTTRSSAGEIYDLYESGMPAFGWQEITSVRASISVQTWQRGDRFATVQTRDTTLGEETIITVAPAKGAGAGYAPPATPAAPPPPVTRQPLR
jgi:hypothetical protein